MASPSKSRQLQPETQAEANGEDNRDAANDNDSWKLRHRGPDRVTPRSVNALRARQRRNFLATLNTSRKACRCSSPAMNSGQTQGGNNNAYCQDSPLAWLDWNHYRTEQRQQLRFYARSLMRLRQNATMSSAAATFFAGRMRSTARILRTCIG